MGIELAIIDMDGTLYSGETAIDDPDKALDFLNEEGIETVFLTNYAGRIREAYVEKLEKIGIEASKEDIVTSGWLTAEYLKENFPGSEVFVLGEKGLKKELQDSGINVTDKCRGSDVVVVSNKKDLSYSDLKEVLQGIGDAELVGTNPDNVLPGDEGLIPGAGTVIEAVKTMTGKNVEVIGKPSENAVETLLEFKDVRPENCMIVGDNLETDVRMGEENSLETVLVLSGVSDRSDLEASDLEPDHVLESISDLESIF